LFKKVLSRYPFLFYSLIFNDKKWFNKQKINNKRNTIYLIFTKKINKLVDYKNLLMA
jgi:hypothetical protein